jgi:hypothetical protein
MGYAELVDKHHQSACFGFLRVEADAIIGGQVWRYHRFDKGRFAHPTRQCAVDEPLPEAGDARILQRQQAKIRLYRYTGRMWGRG